MRLDELSAADRQEVWRFLTRRQIRNEQVLNQLLPPIPPLDEAAVEPVDLADALFDAHARHAETEADLARYQQGEARDELVARALSIADQTLIPLTDLGVELRFVERQDPTGMAAPFLWHVVRDEQVRGLVLRLGAVLRWELQPPVAADDDAAMRRAALQLAMPNIRAAVADPAFFDAQGDAAIVLESGVVAPAWDPAVRYNE